MMSVNFDLEQGLTYLMSYTLILRLLHTTNNALEADPDVLEIARMICVDAMEGIMEDIYSEAECLLHEVYQLRKQF